MMKLRCFIIFLLFTFQLSTFNFSAPIFHRGETSPLWGGQLVLAQGTGLEGLDMPREYRSMRSSSADPNWKNGNGDARPIAQGKTLKVAELEGPGRITHIWFTVSAKDKYYPRTMTLRIYWDGDTEPAFESPLGDFFAVGHGCIRTLNSTPVAVSSEGRAYNCYWPMPFRKSAKITVTNDSDKQVDALFWYVDWQKLPALAESVPYFHAQYRQEFPCRSGEDYLILDAKGKGHYVGTVLSVRVNQPGWFGEGDDRFYIDGEEKPSLRGTGSEDYFCDAWGFREFNNPFYGVTFWEGFESGDRGTVYRWHIPDPVAFGASLKVTIEHKGAVWDEKKKKFTSGFDERSDDFSSVAFWYQAGKAKRFASVPPAKERIPAYTAIEAEKYMLKGNYKPFARMKQDGDMWSGGAQILFISDTKSARVELPFDVEETGDYIVRAVMTFSWDYGIYDIYLDGRNVCSKDFYSPTVIAREISLGKRRLEPGEHLLKFVCKGANERSKLAGTSTTGYFLGIDAVYLYPVK